jgi:glutamyl/glutaminyl-tRNA synthetase
MHHPLLLNEQHQKLSKSAGNAIRLRCAHKEDLHLLLGRFAAFAERSMDARPLTSEELLTWAKGNELFQL